MKSRRITAAERIAFLIGWDYAEMAECRYQPTRYRIAIYTVGDSYMACPRSKNELPRDGFDWKPIGESYGRTVYAHNLPVKP